MNHAETDPNKKSPPGSSAHCPALDAWAGIDLPVNLDANFAPLFSADLQTRCLHHSLD
jgi:hypothetical protein